MKAYFTVEAALVFPMVVGVYVFLIYGMFYQYDRCLLEQDVAVLTVRGASNWQESGEEVLAKLNRQAALLEKERFLSFQRGEMKASIAQGKLVVEGEGRLGLPFTWLERWAGAGQWTVHAEYAARPLSPALTIRACRKLLKEKG